MKFLSRLIHLAAPLMLLIAGCSAPAPVSSTAAAVPVAGTAGRADFEADRKAILAMAGEYQVSFQFDEPVPLKPGYTPHAPHRGHLVEEGKSGGLGFLQNQ